MKKSLLYLFPIFLLSCTASHYHDGQYKGTVYPGGSFFNIHEEVLTVTGNEILVQRYSIGGQLAETLKIDCTQYSDRIEYTEAEGVRKILTVTENGDLQLNAGIVFHKLAQGETLVIEEKVAKPLIRKNNDGTITLLPDQQ